VAEMHNASIEAGKLADLFRQCIESGRVSSAEDDALKLGQVALGVAARGQS